MTLTELANEYEQLYKHFSAKLDAMYPLLCIYRGQQLLKLRRDMKTYYDMACECKITASMLKGYYEEDD